LVLALVFMIVIALVLLAVVTLSGNDLMNTSSLLTQQSLEYRSGGAMDIAIGTVRYTNTSFSGGSCFSSATGIVVGSAGSNSPPVYVDCTSVSQTVLQQNPAKSGVSREVMFYACSTSPTGCKSSNYTVSAVVDFVDGPTCSPTSFGACGQSESIVSWLVNGADS
jgi:hypothetical protein